MKTFDPAEIAGPLRLPAEPARVLGTVVDAGPVKIPHRDLEAEEHARARHRLEHVERLRRTPWGTYVPLPPLPTVTPALRHRENGWPAPTEPAGLPAAQRPAILGLADRLGCSEGDMVAHVAKLQRPIPALGLHLADPSGGLAWAELELRAAASAAGLDPERAAAHARALAGLGFRPALEVFEAERNRMLRGKGLGPAAALEEAPGKARGPSDGVPAQRARGLSGLAWPRLLPPARWLVGIDHGTGRDRTVVVQHPQGEA